MYPVIKNCILEKDYIEIDKSKFSWITTLFRTSHHKQNKIQPEWVYQPSWGFLLRKPELSAVTICSPSSVSSSLSCLQFLLILCRYIPSPIWILVHLLIKFKKIVNRYSFRSTVNCLSIYYYKLIWVIK